MNYKNVVNKNEFRAIYKKNKNYFDNNNINIINNLDNFISYFKEEFKIEEHELAFIINIFLELDYFNDILKDKITHDIFKYIITKRVTEVLSIAAKESKKIKKLVKKTNLNIKHNNKHIDKNYEIIKEIIERKKIKYNYCYLFDDIKYFSDNPNKKENYFLFISLILKSDM